MRATAGLILAGMALAGCGDGGANFGAIGGGMALSAFSFGATKKLPPDHVMSWITGRDCSVVTYEQTGRYCPPKLAVDRSQLYCHQTLGAVECHESPDPYLNGNVPIGSPPPVRVERQ